MHFLLRFMTICGLTISLAGAEPGVLDIDWQALEKQREKTLARRVPYPDALVRGIRDVSLPVYLPASHVYDKNMSVVADRNFYTITLFLKDATIIVTGDRLYQQLIDTGSPLEETFQVGSEIGFVHSEGMMTADFNKFGANYSLQLECKKPGQDRRCLQEEFLRKVFHELVLVGGNP